MFCSNCGSQLPDGAQFCTNCGAAQQPATPVPAYPPAPGITYEAATAYQRKPKFPIVIIPILVLALIITAGILLFGKKAVYLATESVNESYHGYTNTTRREYDDDGRLTSIRYVTEYNEGYAYGAASLRENKYEYDKDGNLESAKLKFTYGDGEPQIIKVEYSYKKGVLHDIEVDHYNDVMEYDIDFTDDGKIKRITVFRDGEKFSIYSYRYHDNGKLKSMQFSNSEWRYSYKSTFDELGRMIEHCNYNSGELSQQTLYQKNLYEYIDDTTICKEDVRILYHNGEETNRSTTRIEPVIKGSKATALSIIVENVENGEKEKLTLSGDVEWDGLEATWEPEVKGDLSLLGYDGDSMELEIEVDKAGNLILYEIIIDGETVQSTETEYIAIKVSRDYDPPNVNDPIYINLNWHN